MLYLCVCVSVFACFSVVRSPYAINSSRPLTPEIRSVSRYQSVETLSGWLPPAFQSTESLSGAVAAAFGFSDPLYAAILDSPAHASSVSTSYPGSCRLQAFDTLSFVSASGTLYVVGVIWSTVSQMQLQKRWTSFRCLWCLACCSTYIIKLLFSVWLCERYMLFYSNVCNLCVCGFVFLFIHIVWMGLLILHGFELFLKLFCFPLVFGFVLVSVW